MTVARMRLLRTLARPVARRLRLRPAGVRLAAAAACLFGLACAAGCSAGPMDRLRARLELKQGNLSYLRGDYHAAIQHYDRALLVRQNSSQASLNKAYGWMALFQASNTPDARQGLADSAIVSFRHYVLLRQRAGHPSSSLPDSSQIDKHILTLMMNSDQSERAIREVLRPRLERNPRDVTTLLMLANLAFEQGALDETLDYHRQRLAIEPENSEAHYSLSVVVWRFSYYDRVAPERRAALLEEGLRAGLRAVELQAGYADALTYVNLLYREMAKHAKTDVERTGFEAKYKQYEEQAKQARDAQKAREAAPQASRT